MSPPPSYFGVISKEAETSDSVLHFPHILQRIGGDGSAQFSPHEEAKEVKKLNHSANERDRRKRINCLYSSLRSLLPPADRPKKLSIPATVTRVVNYIPELEKEVESLIQKKERLLKIISQDESSCHFAKKMESYAHNSSVAVSATRLCDREIMVQVSTMGSNRAFSYAEVLFNLEQGGLLLLHSSHFESYEARVFYNLHLQVKGTKSMEIEGFKQKLLSLFEKQQDQLQSNFGANSFIGELS